MVGNLIKSFRLTMKSIEPPAEWVEPWLDDLTDQVKALRKANPEKTVVVAFALYMKSSRDYIRKITGEPVSFV
jgi:gluconate kinase